MFKKIYRKTVSNFPFYPGQYVEVFVLAQKDRATQAQTLKSLFRETQALPQIQAINEAEIVAEVAAYRSGRFSIP